MIDTKSPQTRIQGLDLIRIIATLAVVLIHCLFQLLFLNDINIFYDMSPLLRVFYFSCVTIGVLGVPLFLMLSGYLLLQRDYNWEKTKKFYKHNFLTILLVWELWIPINALTAWHYQNIEIHKTELFHTMLFLHNASIEHFWYLPMILGMYIFVPALSKAFNSMNDKELLIPLVMIYVYVFLIPSTDYFREVKFDIRLDLGFAGGFYGSHVIFGYAFYRFEQQIKNYFSKLQLIMIIITSMAVMTGIQIWLPFKTGSIFHLWYEFFLIPPTTIAIFLLFRDIKFTRLSKLIENMSTCSFGIYLIHMALIMFLQKNGFLNFTNSLAIKVIALFAVVPISSFVLVFFLRKVPYLGKLFFR